MYKIQITSDNKQEQSFNLYDMNLRLTLYYSDIGKNWQFDLYNIDNDKYIAQSSGLSANSPALIEKSLPFIVCLYDDSGVGINPITKDDLISRFSLYFMTKDEYLSLI